MLIHVIIQEKQVTLNPPVLGSTTIERTHYLTSNSEHLQLCTRATRFLGLLYKVTYKLQYTNVPQSVHCSSSATFRVCKSGVEAMRLCCQSVTYQLQPLVVKYFDLRTMIMLTFLLKLLFLESPHWDLLLSFCTTTVTQAATFGTPQFLHCFYRAAHPKLSRLAQHITHYTHIVHVSSPVTMHQSADGICPWLPQTLMQFSTSQWH